MTLRKSHVQTGDDAPWPQSRHLFKFKHLHATMMAHHPDPSAAPAASSRGSRSTTTEADSNAASVVDAVMPHGLVMPPAAFSTDASSSMPLTTAELRDHLIALYNSTDSIRKYCRANGIPSKRTTLSTAMAESGLAKRKLSDFPFDRSILKMIDDYTKTYGARKSVNAKMSRMDLREHLINIYNSSDSIRKYCKDHNLTSRRSTMTRAFSESGLAAKKEAKEHFDETVTQLVDAYLDKLPSMKDKPTVAASAEAAKQPPKIALKTAKQQQTTKQAQNKNPPPDEVQLEYIRSVLRTTPPGKAIEVMKDTTYEPAMRDAKDPERWWMTNPAGGPPISVTTTDLLKWTVKRPDAGLSEMPNYRGIPLAVEDSAKESATSERQIRVDGVFLDANDKIKENLLEKISDASLKEKLREELQDVDLLSSVKEDIQFKLDAPFKTTVSVTHEGKTKSFEVHVGGLVTTVIAKDSSRKRKVVESEPSLKTNVKQKKTGATEVAI